MLVSASSKCPQGVYCNIKGKGKWVRTLAGVVVKRCTYIRPVLLACFLFMAFGLSACGPAIIQVPTAPGPEAVAIVGYKVVQTASTQVGKPYRLGGDTPREGFDCSGLIYWAYEQNGVRVPRVTTSQAQAGVSVKSSKLLPGDILVFRSKDSSSGLHTAIYAGQGKFIHSPNSRSKVRIEQLAVPHWKKTLVDARRIVAPVAVK